MLKITTFLVAVALATSAFAQTPDPDRLANDVQKIARQEANNAVDTKLAAQPGYYAQHSAKYQQYIANCRSDGTTPALRDEAAHRYEQMSQKDFDQQIEFCQKREAESNPPAPQQKVAGMYPPPGSTGYYVRGGVYAHETVTDADYDAVKRLADKYFGPAPGPYYGSGVTRTVGAPPPGHSGCRVVQSHDDPRGITQRWWCAR